MLSEAFIGELGEAWHGLVAPLSFGNVAATLGLVLSRRPEIYRQQGRGAHWPRAAATPGLAKPLLPLRIGPSLAFSPVGAIPNLQKIITSLAR